MAVVRVTLRAAGAVLAGLGLLFGIGLLVGAAVAAACAGAAIGFSLAGGLR